MSIRTNAVESFFATRLFYVPKNTIFPRTYEARMKMCAMRWNETRVSDCYINLFADNDKAYRKNWLFHVHNRVFDKFPSHDYVEYRRGKINSTLVLINQVLKPQIRTKYTKKM